ncbi:MAG TPA: penicillin-insensitive murein endopeptidase [Herpetosiphonaceae bacterium]
MTPRASLRSVRNKILMLALLGMIVLGGTLPARAFSSAFFPTQSIGNRGVDVKAIQLLLNISADGIFGSGTDSAVKSFQSSRGLAVDGIVGPATWDALTPTVRNGSTGNAVKALQLLLNEKNRAGLSVDGVFGSGTDAAVRNFQSHAGLAVDGIVGPTTWKNLVWHYDYPNWGTSMCDQDPDANGLANWGTGAAIGQLEAAANAFIGLGQGRVPVGDVSREHGGDIAGHASHEVGLDVDVWPIRTDNAQCTGTRITWQSSAYDRAATRELVRAIRNAAPGHIKVIYFNDPQLISEGLTTQYANHDNHLHIRYCEKIHPNSLYDC